MTYVLGAPGSGKSTIAPFLRCVLATQIVIDWDDFMPSASELAERDVRRSPSTWSSYRRLVRAIVDTIHPASLVLLGVCTPDELQGWPIDRSILLDCSDEERRRRLRARPVATDTTEALADAARYRSLDLPVIETTNRTPQAVAEELADVIRRQVR